MTGSPQPSNRPDDAIQSAHAADGAQELDASPGVGPVRVWRGLLIQSLDDQPPWPPAVQTGEAPLDAPLPASFAGAPTSPRLGPPRVHGWALSNEHTFTIWARATECASVYTDPGADRRRVADLRPSTEEGFPEIYLVRRLHRDGAGGEWVQLRLPQRPNGTVGWARRGALGALNATRDLLVLDRRRRRLDFFTAGRLRWSAAVTISDRDTPTPPGHFWIRERFKIFDQRSGCWPYGFGTSDYAALSDGPGGGAVVIHGSHVEADGAPARPANGCVGVSVTGNAWLGLHLGLGTPLRVL